MTPHDVQLIVDTDHGQINLVKKKKFFKTIVTLIDEPSSKNEWMNLNMRISFLRRC